MHTNKRTNQEQEFSETFSGMFCRGMPFHWRMPGCCGGMDSTEDCRSMMVGAMKVWRWFPLIPIVIGIGLFILGYYLDTETSRLLCMVAGGVLTLFGLLGLIMVGCMRRMCCR